MTHASHRSFLKKQLLIGYERQPPPSFTGAGPDPCALFPLKRALRQEPRLGWSVEGVESCKSWQIHNK